MPSSTVTLENTRTEVSVQHYADSTLVIVTQVGKVGNLVWLIDKSAGAVTPAVPDPSEPNVQSLPPPPIAVQLVPLLGAAPSDHIQTLHNLYASQIATLVWLANSESPLQVARKKVVVGIALRRSGKSDSDLSDTERTTFHGVMAALQELLRHA
ncbi:hypothetical protein D9757_007707 [Collybiopsis confluens]|uniref:Proteasome assembly chaperone 3 n=1 Tax=Collybiopsis confluens TaxID=2823264 RepID=A0A8H5M0R5_9AGAR|nr:hypothetical protein D9757_007707 [Collybiopsis confluens]